MIPLSPYFFVADLHDALVASISVTLSALLIFGGIKARFTGISLWKGGFQTVFIGGLAAAAAFLIARLFR
jgi:VIT1/CCC1 family predicted Fe2+/Mn2+ transporter